MNKDKKQSDFTQKEIAAAIQIWNRASITLLDIRHNLISPEEAVRQYRLPASTFIYTSGRAELSLNNTRYHSDRFGLFHGGKGTELLIRPQGTWLEYYLVLYKFGEPAFHRREFHKLLEETNPFRQQYGLTPANPLLFADQLKKIFEHWKSPAPLNLFYGKGAFYQFVYEVYAELEQNNVQILEPDMISMAVRYLDEHYGESISIQELCEMLGISYSHFHRNFKQKIGSSPQEYLIRTRLEAAVGLLETSDASLREIAFCCGLGDEQGLYRLFKKKTGVSPSAYRENLHTRMRDDALQNIVSFPYNYEDQVSPGELKGKGEIFMFKQIRSKAAVAAALSIALMMTACGTAPANTGGEGSVPTSAMTSQAAETEETEPVEEGTRTISTVMGNVEVPVNPKRIVVDYLIGDVVALGVTPLGVAKAEEGDAKTAFADKIIESVSIESWELDAEEVMALEPDLIILAFSQDPYEDLSKIAPTVYVPYGDMTTEERIQFIGDVLNKPEAAETVLNSYKEKISTAKQTLQNVGLADAEVTIGQFGDDGSYIAGAKHAVGVVVYNELGLKVPGKVQTEIIDKDEYWGNVSMEVLETFCGDYIISLGEIPATLNDNAVWQSIPAVQNGKIIDTNTSITWYTDVISSGALIDIIVDELLTLL